MRDLRHLKNNTPVNTEVLWGGGLWWGLWAGAPTAKHVQQVLDVDATGDLYREDVGWCTQPTRCSPSNYYLG